MMDQAFFNRYQFDLTKLGLGDDDFDAVCLDAVLEDKSLLYNVVFSCYSLPDSWKHIAEFKELDEQLHKARSFSIASRMELAGYPDLHITIFYLLAYDPDLGVRETLAHNKKFPKAMLPLLKDTITHQMINRGYVEPTKIVISDELMRLCFDR